MVFSLLLPLCASAQSSADLDRPSRRAEEVPIEEPKPRPPRTELEAAPEAIPPSALPNIRIFVQTIRVRGNTLVPALKIRAVVDRYVERELSSGKIETLRRELTQLYVDRGFLTSGVIVPDQDFDEQILTLQVIEGRLAAIRIRGENHLRKSFIRRAVGGDMSRPLNILDLEERLRRFQAQTQIDRVAAALRPGLRLGESILYLEIEESPRFGFEVGADNHRSTVIGEYEGTALVSANNLVGWGDEAVLRIQAGSGFTDILARYSIRIPETDGRIALRVRYGDSDVVENPLKALDIESDFLAFGVEIDHPILQTDADEVRVGALLEWRRGRSEVDGERFSFSEGADRGVSQVVPVRFFGDWVHRSATSVVALRAQLSQGLPLLGATNVREREEDGIFTVGLIQGQWAQRFSALGGLELIARGDLQLASDPLLSLEQFSLGGYASVRGYRENELIRDNGFSASLEFRMPILRRPDGRPILQFGPFVDVGRAWNDSGRPASDPDTLASIGLGLRATPWKWLRGELYWGHPLTNKRDGRSGAQESGFHFSLSAIQRW